VVKNLDISVQKTAGLISDEAPSMAAGNSGVYSLITNDIKNTAARDLIICHSLTHQDRICGRNPRRRTLLQLFQNSLISLGLKVIIIVNLTHTESGCGDVLFYMEVYSGQMFKLEVKRKCNHNISEIQEKHSPQFLIMMHFALTSVNTNELYINLRAADYLVNEVFDKVAAWDLLV
jgi:hypothetical protein